MLLIPSRVFYPLNYKYGLLAYSENVFDSYFIIIVKRKKSYMPIKSYNTVYRFIFS